MYHDIVPAGRPDSSGFKGGGPARYKVDRDRFEAQLDRLEQVLSGAPRAGDTIASDASRDDVWALTFDDGGSGALEAAQLLARRGWSGMFFVVPSLLGSPGFLSAEDVQQLYRDGHVIGSHSQTHPARLASLPRMSIREEWRRSREALSELLEAPVTLGSVPGGSYSRDVGRAAAAAGLTTLFTSAPVRRIHRVDGCMVVGRYAVRAAADPSEVAAAACGREVPWLKQNAAWIARGAVKKVGGTTYLRFRTAVLNRV